MEGCYTTLRQVPVRRVRTPERGENTRLRLTQKNLRGWPKNDGERGLKDSLGVVLVQINSTVRGMWVVERSIGTSL